MGCGKQDCNNRRFPATPHARRPRRPAVDHTPSGPSGHLPQQSSAELGKENIEQAARQARDIPVLGQTGNFNSLFGEKVPVRARRELLNQSWSSLFAQPITEVVVPGIGLVPVGGFRAQYSSASERRVRQR